jgi:hypothetical protein
LTVQRPRDGVSSLLAFKEAVERGELNRSTGKRIEIVVHPGNTFDPRFGEEVELLRSGWLNRVQRSESVRQGLARRPRNGPLSRSYDQ